MIGIGFKKLLYIELDYKNWMINIGGEIAPSFYSLLVKLLKCGFTKDISLYGEININLKPKSLKDIFGYDYGISSSKTIETPYFYVSSVKSISLRDNNDEDEQK